MGRIKVLESQNPAVTPEAPTGEPDAYIPAPAPDAVTFFFQVMNDLRADPKLRLDAAKSHAMYTVAKPGEMGKKEQRKEDAQRSGAGKFATAAPPPRLVVDNTR
jgi:phage terminase small subunit